MDKDVYYDIPTSKSLPSIIKDDIDSLKKIKLKKISIKDIYELEPFNNKNNQNNIIIIVIIVLMCLHKIIIIKK